MTILYTDRLILRPWTINDAENLYEYAKDPRVGPAAGWPPHTSVENSREIIENLLSAPGIYAICFKDENQPIGVASLSIGASSKLTGGSDEAELGYWIGVPFWGRGLVTEATAELMRHAFEDLKLNRLWCGIFDGNEKSQRVREKCGFIYHHSNHDMEWKLLDTVVTEHVYSLSKLQWLRNKGDL